MTSTSLARHPSNKRSHGFGTIRKRPRAGRLPGGDFADSIPATHAFQYSPVLRDSLREGEKEAQRGRGVEAGQRSFQNPSYARFVRSNWSRGPIWTRNELANRFPLRVFQIHLRIYKHLFPQMEIPSKKMERSRSLTPSTRYEMRSNPKGPRSQRLRDRCRFALGMCIRNPMRCPRFPRLRIAMWCSPDLRSAVPP